MIWLRIMAVIAATTSFRLIADDVDDCLDLIDEGDLQSSDLGKCVIAWDQESV